MRTLHRLLALAATVLLFTSAGLARRSDRTPPAPEEGLTPVVFVPGMTGTELLDRETGAVVWGNARTLLRPRDGGRNLVLPIPEETNLDGSFNHPQLAFEPIGPIWKIRLLAWTKPVYAPLRDAFEVAGYQPGDLTAPRREDTFFFFNYDWRHGNIESARRLDRRLSTLSKARGGTDVDLVCQSNAAKICRWLVKYGAADLDDAERGVDRPRNYRIRSVVLAGASNAGALRVFKFLIRGRRYIGVLGRKLQPELFFTLRPLFEDLPLDRNDLFFDDAGELLKVDLFDPDTWVRHGWSIFNREAIDRLRRRPDRSMFGTRSEQVSYLERQLSDSRRLQRLLAADVPDFPEVDYFLLENDSRPTIDRALLVQKNGEWRVHFLGDRLVARDPRLLELAAVPGDGHAVIDSQRGLSPQETGALVARIRLTGGHFEAIISPRSLSAMIDFLAAKR